MKKIIITITRSGLIINASGLMLLAINPPEIISEKFFLKIMNESTLVCLN